MNDVAMLRGAEPRKILQTIIDQKAIATMTYSSGGKWHVAKVQPTGIGANVLEVELIAGKKPYPVNIHISDSVGISIKYGYGKFIFKTKIVGLEPPSQAYSGGKVVLALPRQVEMVGRRSYFRARVPQSLSVEVLLSHHGTGSSTHKSCQRCWSGELVDISAGGMQIAFDSAGCPQLRSGQFVSLTLTPTPGEPAIVLTAQVRNSFPAADDKSVCIGLQIVGLEANPEGGFILSRLAEIVEHYHRMNQAYSKQALMNMPQT